MLYDSKIQLGYKPDDAESILAEVSGLGNVAAKKARLFYEERCGVWPKEEGEFARPLPE